MRGYAWGAAPATRLPRQHLRPHFESRTRKPFSLTARVMLAAFARWREVAQRVFHRRLSRAVRQHSHANTNAVVDARHNKLCTLTVAFGLGGRLKRYENALMTVFHTAIPFSELERSEDVTPEIYGWRGMAATWAAAVTISRCFRRP